MLSLGANDVAAARIGKRDALDGEVVGLGGAAGEDDLAAPSDDAVCHAFARGLECRLGAKT